MSEIEESSESWIILYANRIYFAINCLRGHFLACMRMTRKWLHVKRTKFGLMSDWALSDLELIVDLHIWQIVHNSLTRWGWAGLCRKMMPCRGHGSRCPCSTTKLCALALAPILKYKLSKFSNQIHCIKSEVVLQYHVIHLTNMKWISNDFDLIRKPQFELWIIDTSKKEIIM